MVPSRSDDRSRSAYRSYSWDRDSSDRQRDKCDRPRNSGRSRDKCRHRDADRDGVRKLTPVQQDRGGTEQTASQYLYQGALIQDSSEASTGASDFGATFAGDTDSVAYAGNQEDDS